MDLSRFLPFAIIAGVFVAASKVARENPLDGFVDRHGIFHPIRSSSSYNDQIPLRLEKERKAEGVDTAEQQLQRQFHRHERAEKALGPYVREIERLKAEREGYRGFRETSGASDLTKLIRRVNREGAAGGEVDLIPLSQAKRLTGKRHFTSTVTKNGHQYVAREYVLDELAEEAGYRDAAHLEKEIVRANKMRQQYHATGRKIRHLESELKRKREALSRE